MSDLYSNKTLKDLAIDILCKEILMAGISVMEKRRTERLTEIALEMPNADDETLQLLRKEYSEIKSINWDTITTSEITKHLGLLSFYKADDKMKAVSKKYSIDPEYLKNQITTAQKNNG